MSMNHHTPLPAPKPLCAVFKPQLPLLTLGKLTLDEATEVRAHLADCAYCQLHLREYEILAEALHRHFGGAPSLPMRGATRARHTPTSPPEPPPMFTLEDIMNASQPETPVQTMQPPPHEPPQQRHATLALFGAIAAALVVVILAASLFAYFGLRPSGPAAKPTPSPRSQAPATPTVPITPLPTVGSGRLTCTAPTDAGFPSGSGAFYPIDQRGNAVDGQEQGSIAFHADGSFSRAGPRGCYTLNHQQIQVIDDVNTFQACELSAQVGLYTWAFDGTYLRFTRVNDDCLDRAHTLTNFRWKSVP